MLARLNGMFRLVSRLCHLSSAVSYPPLHAPHYLVFCSWDYSFLYIRGMRIQVFNPSTFDAGSLLVRPASRPPVRSRVSASVIANYRASTSVILCDATFPHSPSRPIRSSIGCSSPSPLSLQLLYSADNQGLRLGLCCTQVSFPLTNTLSSDVQIILIHLK